MDSLGRRLTQLRKDRRLSQEKLAGELGVSRQTIYNWEADIIKPKAENIKSICDYFGLSYNEFYYNCDEASIQETCAAAVEKAVNRSFSRIFMPVFCAVFAIVFLFMVVFTIRCGCATFTDNRAVYTVSNAETGVYKFALLLTVCVISLALAVVFLIQTRRVFRNVK